MAFVYFLLLLSVVDIDGVKLDETCLKDGVVGICTDLKKCETAKREIKDRKTPLICEFQGFDPIVCCFDNPVKGPESSQYATNRPISSTSVVQSTGNDKLDGIKDSCGPIPEGRTANKTGRKAWDKCIEYQQLVYPCRKNSLLTGSAREDNCHHRSVELIVGGSVAGKHEFSHAVLLGYGESLDKLVWLCGGSLISDRFILTAAHCVLSKEWGAVTYAALHQLDRSSMDPHMMFRVGRIISHPEFLPPGSYHDIALLELVAPVPLDSYTVPACLHTGESSADLKHALATTWNTNDILDTNTTRLQKIYLSRYSPEECSKIYPKGRRGGYNDTTQLCYGDKSQAKQICQDDGGNPLVVENSKISCMYNIIGVTSYGKGCLNHSPGVYTRLEPYVAWIESVVWP